VPDQRVRRLLAVDDGVYAPTPVNHDAYRRSAQSRGHELIADPRFNKGTAFTAGERDAFGLRGLLPPGVATIDEQLALELEHVRRKTDELERYIGLAALQDRNETLFYRLLVENLEEFLPIVYTPTVGLACQQFSHIIRRPRGVWITPDDVDRIEVILRSAGDDIRLIVVTDNERILGLGDQGAGGMAIPVGKLALYTAAAGIYPACTLPVSLDVGTDRRELLDDPLYVGHRAPRLRGPAYHAVVEAFVEAVARVFPAAIVQWEDFKGHNAVRVLDSYRHRQPSFNDDIQGTGAVVLAGLLAARRERGGLTSDRYLFVGAGGASIGIAALLQRELVAEGMNPRAAAAAIVMLDSHGLVHTDRPGLPDDQRPFAIDPAPLIDAGLRPSELVDPVAVARVTGSTVLIGATGCSGAFSEALVREVGLHDPEPIVLPLSNPSACAEARPEDILAWTGGRAIVAAGGPSRTVSGPGGARVIGQANNVFIFPGMGLGAIVAQTREITDDMFLVAAHQLADLVSAERLRTGALYPPVAGLRSVARAIASAVIRKARDDGHGLAYSDPEIETAVDRTMWWPDYVPFEPGH
jgi:malate dehydrogenase (oxaloacetate-decarboxylating)